MKKVWWQVSLYCLLAGWLAFKLKIKLASDWGHIKQPDGTVVLDYTRWTVICVGVFLAVVLIGGLVFFRKMTRREIFYSASVLVVLDIAIDLLSTAVQWPFTIYWTMATEWSSIAPVLLIGFPSLLTAILTWVTPYIFVLFGRKEKSTQENKEN